MRIKTTKLDKLFSEYVRKRAKGICERCLKPTEFKKLQCSHFHGRRKKIVRWDPENACALDFYCHMHFTENPLEHTEWFKKRLGERRFNALLVRARPGRKPDLELIALGLKKLLEELNNKNENKFRDAGFVPYKNCFVKEGWIGDEIRVKKEPWKKNFTPPVFRAKR